MRKAVLLKIVLRAQCAKFELLEDQYFLPGVKDGLRRATPQARVELLRFFIGTEHEQAFAIVHLNKEATQDSAFQEAADLVKPYIAANSLDANDARYIAWSSSEDTSSVKELSLFLRKNETLESSRYRSCNGKQCVADAEGFAVLAPRGTSADHFQRVTRLYALAVAYGEALSAVSQEASRVATGDMELAEKAMRSLTKFIVAHYFDHPISTRTRELIEFYSVARDQLRLVEQSTETTAQLNLLSQIVREDRRDAEVAAREKDRETKRREELDRREQARLTRERQESLEAQLDAQRKAAELQQSKLQNRLAIWAFVVAAIGLVQVTPKTVTTFAKDWYRLVRPADATAASSPPTTEETPVTATDASSGTTPKPAARTAVRRSSKAEKTRIVVSTD